MPFATEADENRSAGPKANLANYVGVAFVAFKRKQKLAWGATWPFL